MVAQHGYGPSKRPRIRYSALEWCLNRLAHVASAKGASVHMPYVGTGEAGGSWEIVQDLVRLTLVEMKVVGSQNLVVE